MDIGMLWFDDSSRSFAEKVRRAADYYKEKYGREPTLCLVNPETWDSSDDKKLPVEMRQARLVLPNHFWIGVEDDLRKDDEVGGGFKAASTLADKEDKKDDKTGKPAGGGK